MRAILLSFLAVSVLLFPRLSYGAEVTQPVALWKIFCAHWVLGQGDISVPEVWVKLVSSLNARTMPAGFEISDSNLDAWLRCENEFGSRFDTAEFFSRGSEYFSVASVSGEHELASIGTNEPARLYSRKWTEFLGELRKAVTPPPSEHTISVEAKR